MNYIPTLEHKPGCVWGDDVMHTHRVPIDCATVEELFSSIESLNTKLENATKKMEKMALHIYDLEVAGERV